MLPPWLGMFCRAKPSANLKIHLTHAGIWNYSGWLGLFCAQTKQEWAACLAWELASFPMSDFLQTILKGGWWGKCEEACNFFITLSTSNSGSITHSSGGDSLWCSVLHFATSSLSLNFSVCSPCELGGAFSRWRISWACFMGTPNPMSRLHVHRALGQNANANLLVFFASFKVLLDA